MEPNRIWPGSWDPVYRYHNSDHTNLWLVWAKSGCCSRERETCLILISVRSPSHSYELSWYHSEPKRTRMLLHQRQHCPRVWRNFIALRCVNIFCCCWEQGNAFLFCILYSTSFELKHNNDLPLPFLKARLHISRHVDGSVLLCPNVRWSPDTDGGVHCLFWKVISSETASSYSFKIWGSVLCAAEISI